MKTDKTTGVTSSTDNRQPLSKCDIHEKICMACNARNMDVIAPYLSDQFSYTKFGEHPFVIGKSEYLEFINRVLNEFTNNPETQLHAAIEEENGEEKPIIHNNGIDMVYDVMVEDGLITKILRRPPYSRFKFQNIEEDFSLLLKVAGNYLNDYFTNNVSKPWCWVQTFVPELTFQDFCIAYDNYMLCIMVGLVRQNFDKDPEVLMSNQKMQNLLRECEENNMTPCLCLFDPAGNAYTDGCALFDARTFQPLNLDELKDDNDGLMSAWELHNLGVRYVYDQIVEQGYADSGYCDVLEISPQIFFRDNGKPCYVIVRSVPVGLADEKFVINAKMLESVKDCKGYFVNLRWAALRGGSGLCDEKFLYRCSRFPLPHRDRSNLVNNGVHLVDIDKAINEFPFIEVVND